MSVNIQAVIRAIVAASEAGHEPEVARVRKPVITISRDTGAGGLEIAGGLAERLGLDIYDRQVLDAISKHAKVNETLMAKLHEQASRASDSWLYAIVFGKNVTRDDYLRHLVITMRALYRMGGIIVGRGGHLILAGRDILRIRIIGSVEVCARRMADNENMALAEAKKFVRASNQERGRFIWEMFHSRLNDTSNFDLAINTDRFADYGPVVEIILQALEGIRPTGREAARGGAATG